MGDKNDLPQSNSAYGQKQYWDTRYETEEYFEWFAGYEPYKDILRKNIKTTDKILTLGCGNSKLSEDMYHDGFTQITNTDYSEIVIENMRNKTSNLKKMTWEVKDIYDLDYDDECYDVILEKGTLDALLVDEKDPWRMSRPSLEGMQKILSSVSRILKPGGRFISITFAQPHFRVPIYAVTDYKWDARWDTFGETFHYFIYTMTKGLPLSADVLRRSKEYYDRLDKKHEAPAFFLCDFEGEKFLDRISIDLFD